VTEFGNIGATAQTREYLGRIASAMASMFAIPRDEAVARIGRFWDGLAFRSEPEIVALLHEDPDYWARVIFYGGKA